MSHRHFSGKKCFGSVVHPIVYSGCFVLGSILFQPRCYFAESYVELSCRHLVFCVLDCKGHVKYDFIRGWCNYDHCGLCYIRTRSSIGVYCVLCSYLNTMLFVVAIVGLGKKSFLVTTIILVVVVFCILHGAVLLTRVLNPNLVVGIGFVGTVVFVVGTDFVDVVTETGYVGVVVVLEDYMEVFSDRLVMVLVVCSDHLRYPSVAGEMLFSQVKNMPPQFIIENTLIDLIELDLVVEELRFDIVVRPLGVLGMLCVLKVW